jgi:hypothetical protein
MGIFVKFIALDLSKRQTGYAVWQDGWVKPIAGSKQLGSEFTSDGQCCAKLHEMLSDIRRAQCRFESMFIEAPLTQLQKGGHSTTDSDILIKLAGHAESFAYAMGVRCQLINMASWRKFFIGSMPRGTKGKDWKFYAQERCRALGWPPRNDDEADALGLLDYGINLSGIKAPWHSQAVQTGMVLS